jgi:hypothetical protein
MSLLMTLRSVSTPFPFYYFFSKNYTQLIHIKLGKWRRITYLYNINKSIKKCLWFFSWLLKHLKINKENILGNLSQHHLRNLSTSNKSDVLFFFMSHTHIHKRKKEYQLRDTFSLILLLFSVIQSAARFFLSFFNE